MTPASDRLTLELIAAVHVLKALHEDGVVASIERRTARNRLFALVDRLEAERARPMTEVIQPWSPHNAGNSK